MSYSFRKFGIPSPSLKDNWSKIICCYVYDLIEFLSRKNWHIDAKRFATLNKQPIYRALFNGEQSIRGVLWIIDNFEKIQLIDVLCLLINSNRFQLKVACFLWLKFRFHVKNLHFIASSRSIVLPHRTNYPKFDKIQ